MSDQISSFICLGQRAAGGSYSGFQRTAALIIDPDKLRGLAVDN